MQDVLRDSMWQPRASAWLLSTFAAMAVLLTAIGIFGVVAQTVSQRRAEFGIRLAIGAQARDVLNLVLRRAALMTGVGIIAGLAGAFGLSTLMASRSMTSQRATRQRLLPWRWSSNSHARRGVSAGAARDSHRRNRDAEGGLTTSPIDAIHVIVRSASTDSLPLPAPAGTPPERECRIMVAPTNH